MGATKFGAYGAGYGYAAAAPDEPAVVAARADHLAAHGVVGGVYASAPYHHAAGYAAAAPVVAAGHVAGPVVAPVAAPLAHPVAYGYAGPLHVPTLVAHPNGAVTPADEPAVVAARADHLAAHGVVGGVYASAPYNYAAGYAPYAGLVA